MRHGDIYPEYNPKEMEKEKSMNQVWLMLTKEGDKVVLNIMTAGQRNDYLMTNKRKDIINQIPIECDALRILNLSRNKPGLVSANWFDRLLLKGNIYSLDSNGSLIYEGSEDKQLSIEGEKVL
jgi:hypothetical protein